MDPRVRNTLLLMYGTLVYLAGVTIIILVFDSQGIEQTNNDIYLISIGLLIVVLVAVWGYKLKIKMPGTEISMQPVDRLMRPPTTIPGNTNVEEAEKIMEKNNFDFLNIIDEKGILKGVFTRTDAHRARKQRKIRLKIEELMTPFDKIVKANRGENLADIIQKIGSTRHARLPVLDDKKLIGVIDSLDIQDFLAKQLRDSL